MGRGLFLLILAGLVLIAMTPEAWFVLPAFDAIGLDVATILVTLELQRYFQGALWLVSFPAVRDIWRWARVFILELAMMAPGATRNVSTAVLIVAGVLVSAVTLVQCLGIWRSV